MRFRLSSEAADMFNHDVTPAERPEIKNGVERALADISKGSRRVRGGDDVTEARQFRFLVGGGAQNRRRLAS